MKVIETQIIDANNTKTVISNEVLSFNLLELTENNPVTLAHTTVSPGTYKQIRLILDGNSTITLSDGTVHPIKTPSGEHTGIKIDGLFEIPEGRLYSLNIDLDPAQSVHYTEGNGFMLKPVIELTGSDVTSGNFYFAGSAGSQDLVFALNANGTMTALTSRYPRYYIDGSFYHDSENQQITFTPSRVRCPSCSRLKRYYIRKRVRPPAPSVYDISSFGTDYIKLQQVGSTYEMTLSRVDTFSLSHTPVTKNISFKINNLDINWTDKTIYTQFIPSSGVGHMFTTLSTIEDINNTIVEIDVIQDQNNLINNYYVNVGVLDSNESFTVDPISNELEFEYSALIAKNSAVDKVFEIDWENSYSDTIPLDINFTAINKEL